MSESSNAQALTVGRDSSADGPFGSRRGRGVCLCLRGGTQ